MLDADAYTDGQFASSAIRDTFILCADYQISIKVLQKVVHTQYRDV